MQGCMTDSLYHNTLVYWKSCPDFGLCNLNQDGQPIFEYNKHDFAYVDQKHEPSRERPSMLN